MASEQSYTYDITISYAGEDREPAYALANALAKRHVHVFFDQFNQVELWGRNLVDTLADIYGNRARYCILFLSKHSAMKKWPRLERQIAQGRALDGLEEYILPIHLDETEISGFLSTIASISWQGKTVEDVADMVVEKLSSKKMPPRKEGEPAWFQKFRAGNEYFKRQEFQDALAAYQQAISLDSNPVVYNNKGVALYQIGSYDAALEDFQRAIRLEAHYAIAGLLTQRDASLEEAFLRTFQCDINFLAAYTNAVAYNNRARTLYRLNRYDEALQECEKAIQLDPKFAVAYDTRGRILNRRARYDEALQECEKAIQLDPKLAEAYDDKGWALYGLNRYQESLAACEQAIWLDSQIAAAYNNKGRALNELERYKEALDAYKHAIMLDGNDARVYYNTGQTLRNLRSFEEALEAFEQAIKLDHNYAAAYQNKGQILLRLQRYEKALQAFDQAIKLYEDALKSPDRATIFNSKLAVAYKDKGQTLYKLAHRKKALKAFEQAIQLDPQFADAYTGKGNVLKTLGRHGEAQKAFVVAARLRSNSS